MKNLTLVRWINVRHLVTLAMGLSLVGSASAQVSLDVSSEGPYYSELPVFLAVTVSNQTEQVVSANSVGHGSPWIIPSKITREDGTEIGLSPVTTARWRTSIALEPGEVITGRLDVAPFAVGAADTGCGLPAGKYSITIQYRPGTNRDDRITSCPILVTIMDPPGELTAAREGLRNMRRDATAASHTLPDGFVATARDTENPYWFASRVHYARWLSRRKRFDEAIPVWKDLLSIRNPAADLYRIDVSLELAQCYMLLKEKAKARELLEPIKDKSDVAYGMLRILADSNE